MASGEHSGDFLEWVVKSRVDSHDLVDSASTSSPYTVTAARQIGSSEIATACERSSSRADEPPDSFKRCAQGSYDNKLSKMGGKTQLISAEEEIEGSISPPQVILRNSYQRDRV